MTFGIWPDVQRNVPTFDNAIATHYSFFTGISRRDDVICGIMFICLCQTLHVSLTVANIKYNLLTVTTITFLMYEDPEVRQGEFVSTSYN